MNRVSLHFCILLLLISIFYSIFSSLKTFIVSPTSREEFDSFCRLDDSVSFEEFQENDISSANCYGNFTGYRKKEYIPGLVIEMKSVSKSLLRRCHENPYHAFYDCIWPLVYYISTCVRSIENSRTTLVLTNESLSFTQGNTWMDGSLNFLLHSLQKKGISFLDATRIGSDRVVCFTSKTKIFMNGNWRPPKLSLKRNLHPERMVADALDLFRNLIISSIPPISRSKIGHIIVYDRGDARRRRWINGFDFAYKLNRSIGDRYHVVYLWSQPDTFMQQVALHSGAVALIAPHGAAFANSLFMPRKSVLMEIASRNCGENISHLSDARNENAWTAWHASRLQMKHVTVNCNVVRDKSKLISTDIRTLLKTTITLIERSQNGLGSTAKIKKNIYR